MYGELIIWNEWYIHKSTTIPTPLYLRNHLHEKAYQAIKCLRKWNFRPMAYYYHVHIRFHNLKLPHNTNTARKVLIFRIFLQPIPINFHFKKQVAVVKNIMEYANTYGDMIARFHAVILAMYIVSTYIDLPLEEICVLEVYDQVKQKRWRRLSCMAREIMAPLCDSVCLWG